MAESPVFRMPFKGFLRKFIGEDPHAEIKVIGDGKLLGDVGFEGY